MPDELTVILVKPDAIHRGISMQILHPFEAKGLKLRALKLSMPGEAIWREHYAHLVDEPFFQDLLMLMTSTPIIASVWSGADAVEVVRDLVGVTMARRAAPGTIRSRHALSVQANVVHASDSVEAADEEVVRFFRENEIFAYDRVIDSYLYAPGET